MKDQNEFEDAYSDEGFWNKLGQYAKAAGKEVVEKALLLYYAGHEEDAPAWAKATIIGSLGYFIAPLDAIVDLTPVVGSDALLVCATETKTEADIEAYIAAFAEVMAADSA